MGCGEEELRKKLQGYPEFRKSAEYILCGGDTKRALQEVRSSKVSRPDVRLYTNQSLPGGENLFQQAAGVISPYNVFYA
jgi:hypothetical protein